MDHFAADAARTLLVLPRLVLFSLLFLLCCVHRVSAWFACDQTECSQGRRANSFATTHDTLDSRAGDVPCVDILQHGFSIRSPTAGGRWRTQVPKREEGRLCIVRGDLDV